jgi:hypothetical protein
MLVAAAKAGARKATGIEPHPFLKYVNHENHLKSLADYQSALLHFRIDPSTIEMIEAGIEDVTGRGEEFDLITIYDVLEHAPNPALMIRRAYELAAPGGLCLLSTAPLFFSMNGHHMAKAMSGDVAWAHLKPDWEERISKLPEHKQRGFRSLNRVTAGELETASLKAGWEIVGRKRKLTGEDLIDQMSLPDIPREDLLTEASKLLLRKPC